MDDFYKKLMYNIKDINTILNNYKTVRRFCNYDRRTRR